MVGPVREAIFLTPLVADEIGYRLRMRAAGAYSSLAG